MDVSMPTPPESSIASSAQHSELPQPRPTPLKPGSNKEATLIRYLDAAKKKAAQKLAIRSQRELRAGDEKGYKNFAEAAKDIDGMLDVIWVSGTPNIQIPYLINIAFSLIDFLRDLPPSPCAASRLLTKMDDIFASLLAGRNLDTGEVLAGFSSGDEAGVFTTTQKVRLKSIAERTRGIVGTLLADRDDIDEEDKGEDADDEGGDTDAGGTITFEGFDDAGEEEDEELGRGLATVYEKTLAELGEELVGPPIGIITEDWDEE